MVLSVIIVNYQVRYFLELSLRSVEKALRGLDAEVWVVDNCSQDGSVDYLRPLFPWVQFIVNSENRGFARANNQALEKARGKFILFLNPDTVLPEDFFTLCLGFLESTPQMGGLGVRMVDGSGLFLKESRRGFPSPWVAFCKLTGLTALFPHSRFFARYYLGHLSPAATQRAPVLSGACLWVSRAVLDKVGSFDEQFFMYAEDIDLSYRIEQAGYHNYYSPDTTIVHFKGESTRKDIRYVKLFYKAMSQFWRKHFHGVFSVLFNGLMEAAIWLRAAITALRPAPVAPREGTPEVAAWLTGDPGGMERLSAILSSSGKRRIVADPRQADEIVFCEGEAFSFKKAIAEMQAIALRSEGRRVRFKIYAVGSASVTGSASKEGRGETIVW